MHNKELVLVCVWLFCAFLVSNEPNFNSRFFLRIRVRVRVRLGLGLGLG